MKKEYINLILFIILCLMFYVKDISYFSFNKNNLIKKYFEYEIKENLNDYKDLKIANDISYNLNIKCLTRIKSYNPTYFYRYLNIYNSNKCNLKKGDTVVNDKGLVGIIDKVSKKSARVILVSNNKLAISVNINNNYGTLKNSSGKSIIEDIKINNIKIGERIYTSKYSKIPSDIYIGKVSRVDNKEHLILNVDLAYLHTDNPYLIIIGA